MLVHEVAHPLGQSQPNSRYGIMKEFLYPGDYLLDAFTDLCTGLYFCFNFEEKALEVSFSEKDLLDRKLINDGFSFFVDIGPKEEFFCS